MGIERVGSDLRLSYVLMGEKITQTKKKRLGGGAELLRVFFRLHVPTLYRFKLKIRVFESAIHFDVFQFGLPRSLVLFASWASMRTGKFVFTSTHTSIDANLPCELRLRPDELR